MTWTDDTPTYTVTDRAHQSHDYADLTEALEATAGSELDYYSLSIERTFMRPEQVGDRRRIETTHPV